MSSCGQTVRGYIAMAPDDTLIQAMHESCGRLIVGYAATNLL